MIKNPGKLKKNPSELISNFKKKLMRISEFFKNTYKIFSEIHREAIVEGKETLKRRKSGHVEKHKNTTTTTTATNTTNPIDSIIANKTNTPLFVIQPYVKFQTKLFFSKNSLIFMEIFAKF